MRWIIITPPLDHLPESLGLADQLRELQQRAAALELTDAERTAVSAAHRLALSPHLSSVMVATQTVRRVVEAQEARVSRGARGVVPTTGHQAVNTVSAPASRIDLDGLQ